VERDRKRGIFMFQEKKGVLYDTKSGKVRTLKQSGKPLIVRESA